MKTKKLLLTSLILGICFFNACTKSKSKFDFSLIPVKSGDKWEYIDKEGKIVINPQFSFASLFHEEFALVAIGGSGDSAKVGYISKDGKYIINPTYKYGTYFSEDLACVVPENGVPTYVNSKGEIKFSIKDAERASIFSNGLAFFIKLDKDGNELYGYVDKTGNIKIPAIYYDAWLFNEGLAPVKNKENKWGYINNEGTLVINFQFNDPGNFNDGMARVSDGKTWGYIDKNGKYLINPQFDEAFRFTQGLAAIKQGKTWGFINKEGKIIINPQFDKVFLFNDDLAAVKSSDKWGCIDKEGKYIINPQFEDITVFSNGIALVKSNGKVGLINNQGKYIVNPQFDEWSSELCISDECWSQRSLDNFSYYLGGQVVGTDFFDINSVSAGLISSISKTEFNSFNSTTKIDDVLKKHSITDTILPDNSYSSSFKIKSIKINNEASYSVIFHFNTELKEPIKEASGKDWYGRTTYKITGYEKSDKALLTSIEYTVDLGFKASKKVEDIIKSFVVKFEKGGFDNYTKDENLKLKSYILATDNFIVIAVYSTDHIQITIWNSIATGFDSALQGLKREKK